MMVVALAILSPVFRGQLISMLSMIIAVGLLLGVVGLILYLLVYLKKDEALQPQSLRPLKRTAVPFNHFNQPVRW